MNHLLLSNYSNLSYIFNLEVGDFLRLVNQLLKSEQEKKSEKVDDRLYFRWVLEMMLEENPVSFQEYKDKAHKRVDPKKEHPQQDGVEIIKKVEVISNLYLEKEGD